MADLDVRARRYLISGVNDFNSANDIIDAIKAAGGSGGAVASVFGRTGDVVALAGDYTAAMVTHAVSTILSYADPSWLTALAGSKISGDIAGNAASIDGTITESQVVGLIADLATKAPLASPVLTGVPTAPTATAGTNTNQVATTAFVLANSGSGGGGDKNFVFTQAVAAATWNIVHNLGKYPSVFVVDSADNVVMGDVKYIDINTVTITFASGFAGQAFLN